MTKEQAILLALVPAAYLLGSVPFGLLVGLAKGVDPRKAGSGNIGATNLGRLLGGKFFALVFVLDMLKSLLPTLAGGRVVHHYAGMEAPWLTYLLWIGVGVVAVLGHMCSIFLGFKGGKGVSATAGLVLGIWPYYTVPAVLAIVLFILVFLVWRYVSLASLVASGSFPLFYAACTLWILRVPVLGTRWPLLAMAVLVPGLIFYKHRGNIRRLIEGTEQGFRKRTA